MLPVGFEYITAVPVVTAPPTLNTTDGVPIVSLAVNESVIISPVFAYEALVILFEAIATLLTVGAIVSIIIVLVGEKFVVGLVTVNELPATSAIVPTTLDTPRAEVVCPAPTVYVQLAVVEAVIAVKVQVPPVVLKLTVVVPVVLTGSENVIVVGNV